MTAPFPRQREAGSAGTASAGFRCPPAPHPYQPTPPEPGARTRCVACGAEAHNEMERAR